MAVRPALSIKGRALRYLAQREHSRVELERKLARRTMADPDVDAETWAARVAQALDELTAAGLLDESRAAASMVRSQASKFGDARLRHDLRQRGVPDAVAETALDGLSASEFSRAQAVWQRRFGGQAAVDPRERGRQARFLAGRGFSARVIHRLVRGLEADEAGEPERDSDPDQAL